MNNKNLHEKLQILRSMVKSNSKDDASIIHDASNYIKDLTHKISTLRQEISVAESYRASSSKSHPEFNVETLEEKRFVIEVIANEKCPDLLVFVLEALEQLNLATIEGDFRCNEMFNFKFIAVPCGEDFVDTQMVEQALARAIRMWSNEVDIGTIDDDEDDE